jgi:hypothetical protein
MNEETPTPTSCPHCGAEIEKWNPHRYECDTNVTGLRGRLCLERENAELRRQLEEAIRGCDANAAVGWIQDVGITRLQEKLTAALSREKRLREDLEHVLFGSGIESWIEGDDGPFSRIAQTCRDALALNGNETK